jgi:uncharacterized protein YfaS (alpha-2-macroglobulin family)
MWFFDLYRNRQYDFLVKINAVTSGEFFMPPPKVEAMYNSDYQTIGKSMEVVVHGF